MDYIKQRLREPSTWAGFGILYVAVDAAISSGNWTAGLPAVLGAVIAVIKGDVKA
jgi:hypothetical protein